MNIKQNPGNHYTFYANDGRQILVRPLAADDTALLVDLFDHMSPESRYRRFHQSLDHVPESRIWQEAAQITHFDPAKSFAYIAFFSSPDKGLIPISVARYVDSGPGEGEVAISVRDDFQNLGIGKKLMRLLAYQAEIKGYRRLVASIQNDNIAIWRVFQHLPYHIFRSPDGSYANIIIVLTSTAVEDENDGILIPQPPLATT